MIQHPMLQISKLSVQRGDQFILHEVCWCIEKGQHWVILGANGSGKTSLLRALTAYLTPTDGKIVLLGKVYGESDWQQLRKKIGLVSSSIHQMIPDSESALLTVVSGKEAMIGYWGKIPFHIKKRPLDY